MTLLWNETDLLQATSGQFLSSSPSIQGTGVSIDTRTIKNGDIFIAIIGENSDGHNYVQRALDAGAACAIISQPLPEVTYQDRLFLVSDTMQAMNDMGKYARNRFSGKMLAVTGSVGKTTTKEMLRNALSVFGNVHAAEGSYNNHIGVPLTLARLHSDVDFCVCEIGMNHTGEIAPLAALVKPDIALITEVGSSHLGYMKTLDAIALEKSQIITSLPKQGSVILPEDIYHLEQFKKLADQYHVHLYTTGLSQNASIYIDQIHLDPTSSNFSLTIDKQSYKLTLSSPGKHLIRNAALVIGAVSRLHLDIHKATIALSQFQTGTGRGAILSLASHQGIVLDESYNASKLSIQSALSTLNLLSSKRRIAILGDILELGEYSEQEHLSLIPDICHHADLVFGCGPMMKIVLEQLPDTKKGSWCATANELIPLIQTELQDGDTVLIKGSNSMRMNLIVKKLTTPAEDNN